MANIIQSAKPGSEWTINETNTYNIAVTYTPQHTLVKAILYPARRRVQKEEGMVPMKQQCTSKGKEVKHQRRKMAIFEGKECFKCHKKDILKEIVGRKAEDVRGKDLKDVVK